MRNSEHPIRTHGSFGNNTFANERQYANPSMEDAGTSSGRFKGFRKFGVAPLDTGHGNVPKQSVVASRRSRLDRYQRFLLDRYEAQGVKKYAAPKQPSALLADNPWIMRNHAMTMDKLRRDAAPERTPYNFGRSSLIDDGQDEIIDPNKGTAVARVGSQVRWQD